MACLLALLGLAAVALLVPGPDQAVQDWAHRHTDEAGRAAWRAASWPGAMWLGLALAGAAAALALAAGDRRAAWAAGLAAPVTLLAFTLLKLAIDRDRPAAYGLTDAAFPSGHAAMATAAWGALALVALPAVAARWPGAWWAGRFLVGAWLGLAAGAGLARVLGGVHWATDVLAGWALGGVVLAGAVAVARPR